MFLGASGQPRSDRGMMPYNVPQMGIMMSQPLWLGTCLSYVVGVHVRPASYMASMLSVGTSVCKLCVGPRKNPPSCAMSSSKCQSEACTSCGDPFGSRSCSSTPPEKHSKGPKLTSIPALTSGSAGPIIMRYRYPVIYTEGPGHEPSRAFEHRARHRDRPVMAETILPDCWWHPMILPMISLSSSSQSCPVVNPRSRTSLLLSHNCTRSCQSLGSI